MCGPQTAAAIQLSQTTLEKEETVAGGAGKTAKKRPQRETEGKKKQRKKNRAATQIKFRQTIPNVITIRNK